MDKVLPFNNKEYTPHINAYFRWLNNLKDLDLDNIFTNFILAKSENAIKNEDLMLEALVNELNSELTKSDFKKAIKAYYRTNRSLKKYVDDLLEYKANQLLIRLDLGFNKEYSDKSKDIEYEKLFHPEPNLVTDDNSSNGSEPTSILLHQKRLALENTLLEADLKSIKDYRAKFFRVIKRKYNVVGFIWKLEYGGEKSFHYHCLIMLDGDRHREDITIAKDMGEIWKQITNDESTKISKGIYWNCNADKNRYHHLAIGHLNASDETMKHNLFTYVLPYLAKTDYYLKVAKSKDRTIGMGLDKEKVKSGRPRKENISTNTSLGLKTV